MFGMDGESLVRNQIHLKLDRKSESGLQTEVEIINGLSFLK